MLGLAPRRSVQRARLARRPPSAVSLLVLAALAFASWTAFLPVTQVSIAIGVALVTSLAAAVRAGACARRRSSCASRRSSARTSPCCSAALLSWTDSVADRVGGRRDRRRADRRRGDGRRRPSGPSTSASGTRTRWSSSRAWLDLLDVEQLPTVAVFCLTTTLASVGAIVATLVRRLRAPAWYAVLIVTAVPFLIGIVVTVFERSGWTALSTGVIFALALTLLLTRRPGLNFGLRAISAGLLVPTLAVVVVNLGAEFLEPSGSPVALPIIAVIVAGVLPSTGLIRAGLLRHGLPERDAALARIWIEGSALLTGVDRGRARAACARPPGSTPRSSCCSCSASARWPPPSGASAGTAGGSRSRASPVRSGASGRCRASPSSSRTCCRRPSRSRSSAAIVTGRGGRGAAALCDRARGRDSAGARHPRVVGNGGDGVVDASRGAPPACSPVHGFFLLIGTVAAAEGAPG